MLKYVIQYFLISNILYTVHLCCGIWGTLATPLFDSKRGFFYTGSAASMRQFGWNILCCLVIMLWGILTMFPVYKVMDFFGILRAAHEKLEHELALKEASKLTV